MEGWCVRKRFARRQQSAKTIGGSPMKQVAQYFAFCCLDLLKSGDKWRRDCYSCSCQPLGKVKHIMESWSLFISLLGGMSPQVSCKDLQIISRTPKIVLSFFQVECLPKYCAKTCKDQKGYTHQAWKLMAFHQIFFLHFGSVLTRLSNFLYCCPASTYLVPLNLLSVFPQVGDRWKVDCNECECKV